MKMNKKILSLLVLLGLTGCLYLIHSNRVESIKNELSEKYKNDTSFFKSQRLSILSKLSKSDPLTAGIFDSLCDFEEATSFTDSNISLLFFSDNFKVDLIDKDYLGCVERKSKSESINQKNQKLFNIQMKLMNNKFGESASEWNKSLERSKFFVITKKDECSPYFDNNDEYVLKPNSFTEFDKFLQVFNEKKTEIEITNDRVSFNAQKEINRLKSGLSNFAKAVMEQKVNQNNIVKSSEERFYYNWNGEGTVSYTFNKKNVDQAFIDQAMEDVYIEQFRGNSLRNGSMPYSYCYGGSNSGSSGVKVKAGYSDVLVTIKNMNDRVVRHAYIQSNSSYTINVPNGNYHVYFYYGSGWNPKRFMKDTDCGRLVGGFISNESVSKDPDIVQLYNQVMQYTLTQQLNGNFSTSGSSKFEAF